MTTKSPHLASLFPQMAAPSTVEIDIAIPVSEPTPAAQAVAAIASQSASHELMLLDPWAVVIPKKPNRSADAFETARYEQLRASMQASRGNLEPIRVVRVNADPPRYELSFGERRLRVCRELNLQVLAMVVDVMDEIDDYIDRIRENQGREDLSAWEFAQQIGYVLTLKNPPKQIDLAHQLGIDASQISRAKQLFELPAELIEGFDSPRHIRYEDIKPLRDAWRKDPAAVRAELERIKTESEPLEPGKVVTRIAAAAKPTKKEIASCNSDGRATDPEPIECDEMQVGEWAMTVGGSLAISIATPMSNAQRDGLLIQVQTYLKKRVLKKPVESINAAVSVQQTPSDQAASKEAA